MPPHRRPFVAEEPVSDVSFESVEYLQPCRQSHADRLDDQLVVEVVVGLAEHGTEVVQRLAQQFLGRTVHRGMASAKMRSRSAGLMALSGIRSTETPSTSPTRSLSALSSMRLGGGTIANSRSTSEPSVSEPAATEPNTRTLLPPASETIRRISLACLLTRRARDVRP